MSTLTNKQNGVGLKRLFKALACSYKGFKAAWLYESAFRQELIMALVLMPISFLIASSVNHWLLLVGAILFVLFAEVINSAIEALADSVTLEHHTLIGRAKDLGSSGVFIALSFLVIVWLEAISRFFR